MSENLRNYTKAIYAFDHVMRLTVPKEKTWDKKSPVAGWNGRDVYEHAAGGVKMVQSWAGDGAGPKSGVKLGKNPMTGWAKLRDGVLETLDRPGSLQAQITPFGEGKGPMPVDNFIGFMAAELAVHTWDLARTARVDEELDPGLVKHTSAMWKSLPKEIVRGEGMMGEAIKSEKGADAQTRLLNFVGRKA
jgi:uncharacterized protein (TIGR03086 family)